MLYDGIRHICGFNDCYALNEDELCINVRTNKTISEVLLMQNDPYVVIDGQGWQGISIPMIKKYKLQHEYIWTVVVKPKFKRLQYYFKLTDKNGQVCNLMENGIFEDDIFSRPLIKHYYKFGWMNKADIFKAPDWVKDIFWYQIFPDRFAKAEISTSEILTPEYQNIVSERQLKAWDDLEGFNRRVYYGGNIKGVSDKLEYLKNLGISGIYFTPIFVSNRNHRYNIDDYTMLDPLLGTNQDFADMVQKAHSLGIKVMIDAVFNHSGLNFFAWKDVLKNKDQSKYFDWYYINQDDIDSPELTTDGRYYSFAFVPHMPKLNTNNPEVQDYFCGICKKWIDMWNIDGIRYDVGNEISHDFIKKLHRELKAYKKDIFLLGEIWTESSTYLQGDEYDSVMNYPLLQTMHNFFIDKGLTAKYLRQQVDYCYSLYRQTTNEVIFNLMDSHDVSRVITRCGDYDSFVHHLVLLATMPGSPCIYYGTEIALEGGDDPFNRLPMPWNKVNTPDAQKTMELVSSLIKLRAEQPALRTTNYTWQETDGRLVAFSRDTSSTLGIATCTNVIASNGMATCTSSSSCTTLSATLEAKSSTASSESEKIVVYINASDTSVSLMSLLSGGNHSSDTNDSDNSFKSQTIKQELFKYKYDTNDSKLLPGGVLIFKL